MSGIYLDYNASAPLDPRVLETITKSMRDGIGNASSVHAFGRRQAAAVDDGREQVAALVNARPRDVVFTAGATEANNLALQGLVDQPTHGRTRLLISAVEHASVRETAQRLNKDARARVEYIPVTAGGFVALDALAAMLADDVIAVSVMAANSETGVLNDMAAIAELAARHGALLHSDATQLVGRVGFDMEALGADLVSISSHKICGPSGVGALVASAAARKQLRPLIHGGGHERGLRSGSLNVAGIVGLGHAAELAEAEWPTDAANMAAMRNQLVDGLQAGLSDVAQNGDTSRRLPNTANLCFAGAEAEAVLVNIDPVAVSTGSACSSATIEPSPVLLAMGVSRRAANESLRFSLGRFTTESDIAEAVNRTIEAVNFVRSMNGGN